MTSSKGNVAAPPELRQPEGNLSSFLISLINPSSLIYFLKIKADLEWLYINTGRSQEGPGAVYGILCSILVYFLKEEKSQYDGIVILKVKLSWSLFSGLPCLLKQNFTFDSVAFTHQHCYPFISLKFEFSSHCFHCHQHINIGVNYSNVSTIWGEIWMTGSTFHHQQEDTIKIKEKHHNIVSLNMPVDDNTSSL